MTAAHAQPIKLLLVAADAAVREQVVALLDGGADGGAAFRVDATAGLCASGDDPDAILLDVSAPQGLGPADLLRDARARWPSHPIVVLNDPGAAVHELLAAEHGAQDHLLKGRFDADLLARTIRHAVTRGRAERATAEKHNLLRSIIDALPDHIYAKDLDSRFIIANTAARAFFGRVGGADDLIGRSDFDLFPHDAAASFREEERELMRAGRPLADRERPVTDAHGRASWLVTYKVPLRDAAGRVIGLVGVNRDVTDRRRAVEQLEQANAALAARERELLAALGDVSRSHEQLQAAQLHLAQAEKLESIGRLAAGVAHEVKNPLAVIAMGVEYLSQCGARTNETVAQVLVGMRNAVGRADRVIRGLLDFSVPTNLTLAPHDLHGVLDQAALLVHHTMRQGQLTLKTDLAADLPAARVDANKVEQVFVNLLMNAIHATPSGGTVAVRTYARAADDGGPWVVAEIDDSGTGISAEALSKVFDPFFTTKPTGKGTGLGLSVCKSIVDLHGGTIELANRPEGGTRATVAFRAAAG